MGLTIRLTAAVALKLPEVPVTVTVKVPAMAVAVADRVKTLPDVAGFVPKLALIPPGKPDVLKFTALLKPFRGLIVIVVELDAPWRKARLVGDAERANLG